MQIRFIIRIDTNLRAREGEIVEIEIIPAAENRGEIINRDEERSACGVPLARAAGIAAVRRNIKRYGVSHRY